MRFYAAELEAPFPLELELAKKHDIFKGLKPGDAIEVLWKDAMTAASWLDLETASNLQLAQILSRGTLLALHEDRLLMAMDCGIEGGYHGVGVISRSDILDVGVLERKKAKVRKK